MSAVVFDGWEDWWKDSERASPSLSRRLRLFVEPARGTSLPSGDIVHGHLRIPNALASGRVLTGIVDWDHVGVGTRTLDLTMLLFDWQRFQVTGRNRDISEGGRMLLDRILNLVGDAGFRSLLGYVSIAALAVHFRHRSHEDLTISQHAIASILDWYGMSMP